MHLLIPDYPFVTLQPNFSNTSSQQHLLSFSQHFSYPLPLLRSTPLVQLLLHIDISWPLSPMAFIPNKIIIICLSQSEAIYLGKSQAIVVSSCINSTHFSFVMVSSNKKCSVIFMCYDAPSGWQYQHAFPMNAILRNIWVRMCCCCCCRWLQAIRCRPPIPTAASKFFVNE